MGYVLDTFALVVWIVAASAVDPSGSPDHVLTCYNCSGSKCRLRDSKNTRTCSVTGSDAKCFIKLDPNGDQLSGCASPTKWKTSELMANGCRLLPAVRLPLKTTIVCFCSTRDKCNSDIFQMVEMFPNEQTTAIIFTLRQHILDSTAHAHRTGSLTRRQGHRGRQYVRVQKVYDTVVQRSPKARIRVQTGESVWSESGYLPSSRTVPENVYKMATAGVDSVVHGDPGPFIPKYRDCRVDNGYCDHVCVMSWNGMGYCACHKGYVLSRDLMNCDDINECEEENGGCQHMCHNTQGSYHCDCLPGYKMTSDNTTCQEIDECVIIEMSGCSDTCINTPGSYLCTCPEGFHLKNDQKTCLDTDECQSGTAKCDQLCTNTEGSYVCGCKAGFLLDADRFTCVDKDECENDNGGCNQECINSVGSYVCGCRMGYDFVNDTKICHDIDECLEDNGGCEQFCTNEQGSYKCSCALGYQLESDGRSCLEIIPGDKCVRHNGGCDHHCTVIDASTVSCSCNQGFLLLSNGKTCVDIDECELSPCEGHCLNSPGSYDCICLQGYVLEEDGSCSDIDECSEDNGHCEDVCMNTDGSYLCACRLGYWLAADGHKCVDVDECQMNNGGCEGNCTNTQGSYDCSCTQGYVMAQDQHGCLDIDECSAENYGDCQQICVNTAGSYVCGCAEGYRLAADNKSCEDKNECQHQNGGCDQKCVNTRGSFRCECYHGYSRDYLGLCQDVDECFYGLHNCSMFCVNTPGAYQCACPDGYHVADDLTSCIDVDECTTDNGGCEQYCVNSLGSYSCACAEDSGFLLAEDGQSCMVSCPEPYQSGPDESCHLVVDDRKLNFEEAEEFCRKSHAQAHLVDPENEGRVKRLESLFTQLTGDGDTRVWTAGRYWRAIDDFIWITSFKVVDGFNVTRGPEVTSMEESCLLAEWQDDNFSISGEDCDVAHYFICEIKMKSR